VQGKITTESTELDHDMSIAEIISSLFASDSESNDDDKSICPSVDEDQAYEVQDDLQEGDRIDSLSTDEEDNNGDFRIFSTIYNSKQQDDGLSDTASTCDEIECTVCCDNEADVRLQCQHQYCATVSHSPQPLNMQNTLTSFYIV
jgi:hypothetical protein